MSEFTLLCTPNVKAGDFKCTWLFCYPGPRSKKYFFEASVYSRLGQFHAEDSGFTQRNIYQTALLWDVFNQALFYTNLSKYWWSVYLLCINIEHTLAALKCLLSWSSLTVCWFSFETTIWKGEKGMKVRLQLVPQIDPSVPQPVVQSQRRPLLGPSPGWKRLLPLSHLRHY